MSDLHELGGARDPAGHRDRFAGQFARPAAPVPALVGGAESLEHLLGQLQLLGQRTCDRGVVLDHVVHVAVSREHELKPHPESVERRVA